MFLLKRVCKVYRYENNLECIGKVCLVIGLDSIVMRMINEKFEFISVCLFDTIYFLSVVAIDLISTVAIVGSISIINFLSKGKTS